MRQGVEELKGEVESLGKLSHENVVQICGMTEGPEPNGTEAWQMALEFCESDAMKLLYDKADEVFASYGLELMVDLAQQILQGLCYIHGESVTHLDLKPENVLLTKNDEGGWVAKLADFGMAYVEDSATVSTNTDSDAGALQRTYSPSMSPRMRDPAAEAAPDPDAIAPYGTWEYMPPECWKRRFGKPDFASDIFSFGMMLWEMLARVRIYTAFPGVADIPKPDGTANVELVAARIANGQRPSAPEGCPALLFKVMQACWVREMSARPTAP